MSCARASNKSERDNGNEIRIVCGHNYNYRTHWLEQSFIVSASFFFTSIKFRQLLHPRRDFPSYVTVVSERVRILFFLFKCSIIDNFFCFFECGNHMRLAASYQNLLLSQNWAIKMHKQTNQKNIIATITKVSTNTKVEANSLSQFGANVWTHFYFREKKSTKRN